MNDIPIPSRGPGHCDDDAAWAEFVRQYAGQPRKAPHLSDFALANAVFMADRNALDMIVYQTAAKERIRWLSIELAKAREHAGLTAEHIAEAMEDRHSRRVTELLEANNRYQKEARTARDQRDQLGQALGRVLVQAKMIRADVSMTGPELLMAAETFCGGPEAAPEPAPQEAPIPEAPWVAGAATNAKRCGWFAYFEGRRREDSPFPAGRTDLQRHYREGWDAAKESEA